MRCFKVSVDVGAHDAPLIIARQPRDEPERELCEGRVAAEHRVEYMRGAQSMPYGKYPHVKVILPSQVVRGKFAKVRLVNCVWERYLVSTTPKQTGKHDHTHTLRHRVGQVDKNE